MNTQKFIESIDQLYARLQSLTATKGEEYKRREDNQFSNFERGATTLGLTREQVLMVYLSKHLDSITTYIRDRANGQEKVYAEPISGRIDDAILYLLLLRGMTVENDSVRELAKGGSELSFAEIVAQDTAIHPWDGPRHRVEEAALGQQDGQYAGGRVVAAGGVTTVGRQVVLEPGPKYVMAGSLPEVSKGCFELGLMQATAGLSAVDQLHGVRPGGHVVFRNRGTREDNAMLAEVRERCLKQGLTLEVVLV